MNNMNTATTFIDAVYREEDDPAYKGNPYVEALPALLSLNQYQHKLKHLHKVTSEERSASAERRLVRLGELSQVCVPLPRVANLAQSIHLMLFDGYRNRRPFSPAERQNAQRLYEAQQSGKLTAPGNHHPASQFSMSLVGTPGSGKSFILKKIANMFSPVIFHRELGKWQIPFLFIEMPYDGSSVYTLATQIFLALDRLMPDSGYFRTYVDTKSINAERLCMKALNIAYEMGVGMIVVDEAQNSRSIGNHLLLHRKPSVVAATRTAESGLKKLLITASNVGHMPLMFTGTMELEATTTERASVARRKAGRGSATWNPLTNVVVPAAGISEFDLFMKVLFEMQWLPQPVTYDEKWSKLFFERTQGVPDLMVKLFQSTQVAAIRADAQSLEPRHLEIAFEEFRSAEATLNGLANRDEASLLNLTDLFGLAPPELAQPSSAYPLPQPRTSAMNQKAVELKNLIDKNFTVKDKKAPQHVKPGPVPFRVPPEARDALTQADLRSVTPIAESPLSPIPR